MTEEFMVNVDKRIILYNMDILTPKISMKVVSSLQSQKG